MAFNKIGQFFLAPGASTGVSTTFNVDPPSDFARGGRANP